MARVNESDVRAIIDHDVSISMSPFIEAATVLVNKVSSCASAKGDSLTSNQLREIERYLAAHLYSFRDQLYAEEKTEKASAVYQGKTGMGLDSSPYGYMAKTLDTSGCLASFDKQKSVSSIWLGKPVSEQIAYSDRD